MSPVVLQMLVYGLNTNILHVWKIAKITKMKAILKIFKVSR